MNEFKEKLLNYFNLTNEDFLELTKEPSFDMLEDYLDFINIEKAASRINNAIKNNEKIMIYGDYDCDGIMSTSILVSMFNKLSYSNFGYFIPSRYIDGYGINVDRVEQIIQKKYSLIISVDNGVSQVAAIKKAKEAGIDVIVTDHHEFSDELPECYTIVHPFLKNSDLRLPECGAYVAFMLSRAVLGYYDEYLLTLASIATLSDLMPLISFNRNIVRLGLKIFNEKRYPKINNFFTKYDELNEKFFAFNVAPKINSVGRIDKETKANRLVKYFTTDNKLDEKEIFDFINKTNDYRKEKTKELFINIDLNSFKNKKIIIYKFDHVEEGLIGLVANRIFEEYKKPCFIFTDSEDGLIKGSCRSLDGFSIPEVLSKVSDLLLTYGGHAKAGGLSLKNENFSILCDRLISEAKDKNFIQNNEKIICLEKEDLTYENYRILRAFSPFGEGFREPNFSISLNSEFFSYLSNGKHVKGKINDKATFIAFNTNKIYNKNTNYKLIGKLQYQDNQYGNNIELLVNSIVQEGEKND